LSLHLVVPTGALQEDPVAASQFLSAIANAGGKVVHVATDIYGEGLRTLLEADSLSPDETIFLAATESEARLARSLRLKVASMEQHAAATSPDEIWQNSLRRDQRSIEKQGQLGRQGHIDAVTGYFPSRACMCIFFFSSSETGLAAGSLCACAERSLVWLCASVA